MAAYHERYEDKIARLNEIKTQFDQSCNSFYHWIESERKKAVEEYEESKNRR